MGWGSRAVPGKGLVKVCVRRCLRSAVMKPQAFSTVVRTGGLVFQPSRCRRSCWGVRKGLFLFIRTWCIAKSEGAGRDLVIRQGTNDGIGVQPSWAFEPAMIKVGVGETYLPSGSFPRSPTMIVTLRLEQREMQDTRLQASDFAG